MTSFLLEATLTIVFHLQFCATQVAFFCETFSNTDQWIESYGSIQCPAFPPGGICSGDCLKLSGDSAIYTNPIDATGYGSIYVQYDLDTWEFSGSDRFYVESSVNDGVWNPIQTISTSSSALFDLVAYFSVIADGSSNIRLQLKTDTDGATDDVWIDNLCIYGTVIASAPTKSPTNNPTSASPTRTPTELPTDTPTLLPSNTPSSMPSLVPTMFPTKLPTTTFSPTALPTKSPKETTATTLPPILIPTTSAFLPTNYPTNIPSNKPTMVPTNDGQVDITVATNITKALIDQPDGVGDASSIWSVVGPIIGVLVICLCIICLWTVYKSKKEQFSANNKTSKEIHNSITLAKVKSQSVVSNVIHDNGIDRPIMTIGNDINISEDEFILNGDHDIVEHVNELNTVTQTKGNDINDEYDDIPNEGTNSDDITDELIIEGEDTNNDGPHDDIEIIHKINTLGDNLIIDKR